MDLGRLRVTYVRRSGENWHDYEISASDLHRIGDYRRRQYFAIMGGVEFLAEMSVEVAQFRTYLARSPSGHPYMVERAAARVARLTTSLVQRFPRTPSLWIGRGEIPRASRNRTAILGNLCAEIRLLNDHARDSGRRWDTMARKGEHFVRKLKYI